MNDVNPKLNIIQATIWMMQSPEGMWVPETGFYKVRPAHYTLRDTMWFTSCMDLN